MIEDGIYLVIYLIAEVISYLLAYTVIFGSNMTRKKSRFFLVATILIPIHFILLRIVGMEGTTALLFFTLILVPLLLLEPLKKQNFLLYPFIVLGTSLIEVGLSFLFAVILYRQEYQLINNYRYSVLFEVIKISILLLVMLVKKCTKNEPYEVHLDWKQYLLFNVVAFSLFFIAAPIQALTSGDEMSSKQMALMGLGTSIGCITLVAVTIWQSIIVKKEIQLKEQNILSEKFMELQKEHYEELLKQDEKMRRFRHDMEAHMAVLQSYCAEGGTNEMQEYYNNVIRESAIYEIKSYTGNKGVDAIVRQLLERAEGSQVNMELKGFLPEKPVIKEYDLCTIVANLLKNAIEACEKIDDLSSRRVIMETNYYNEHVYITIKNTVKEEVMIRNNQLVTMKKDKRYHGIGSKNVAQTVKKYNGELTFRCNENWFVAEVNI